MFDPSPDRIDQILLAASAVGAIVFGAALGQDEMLMRWFGPQHGGGEVIGEVTTTHNDVRRRMNRSLGWYNISSNQKIYQRDTFFAGNESEVTFKLRGRDEFTLSPNSLVVLDLRGNDVFIDLREGSIDSHVVSDGAVHLLLNQKVVDMDTKSGHISKTRDGDLNVTNENQVLKIDRHANVKKHDLSVNVTSFHKKDSVWVEKDKPVHFVWTQKKADEKIGLEVAKADKPDEPIYKKDVAGLEEDWLPQELDHSYRYQFVDQASGDVVSSIYSLDVNGKTALQPISPAMNEQLYPDITFAPTDKKPVKFFWEKKSGVKGYHLVVSHTKDTPPVATVKDAAPALAPEKVVIKDFDKTVIGASDIESLGPGDYNWQISNIDEPPLTSEVFDFTVGPKVAPPPPPPVQVTEVKPDLTDKTPQLQAPNQKMLLKFNPPTSGRDIANASNLVNPPALNWRPLEGATEYKVEIANNEKFENPMVYDPISKPHFAWQNAKPGTYYWRILGRGKDGKNSKTSPSGKMVLGLVPPVIDKLTLSSETVDDPKKVESKKPTIIKWQELPYAAGYKVLAGANDAEIVKTPEYNLQMAANTNYEFKVAAVDSKGNMLSPYTTENLKYDRKLVMRAPQSISPSDKVTIVQFAENDAAPMVYRWSESPGAKEYEIELAKDPDFKNIVGTKKVAKSQLVVKKNPTTGKIYWHVRSIFGDSVSEWSTPTSFDVQVAKDKPKE